MQRQGVRGLQGTQSGEVFGLGDERGMREIELQPVPAQHDCECHPSTDEPSYDTVAAEDGSDVRTRTSQEHGEGQVGFADL
ncbi:hypothetical protein MASR2M50_24550 [Thauera sp.]